MIGGGDSALIWKPILDFTLPIDEIFDDASRLFTSSFAESLNLSLRLAFKMSLLSDWSIHINQSEIRNTEIGNDLKTFRSANQIKIVQHEIQRIPGKTFFIPLVIFRNIFTQIWLGYDTGQKFSVFMKDQTCARVEMQLNIFFTIQISKFKAGTHAPIRSVDLVHQTLNL